MNKDEQAIEVMKRAYLTLLKMPHGGVRARNQSTLCALRDAIAKETGEEPQKVQDYFEAMELQFRMHEDRAGNHWFLR